MESDLDVHPLFVALTRPPMYFGVTLYFFLINGFVCLVFFVATLKSFFAGILFCALHATGYLCCLVDVHIFQILWGKLTYLNNKNSRWWQCQSYDPY